MLPDGNMQIPPHADVPTGEYRGAGPQSPAGERERAPATLRAAGLCAEPRAAESTRTLDKAGALRDRASGTPLRAIVLEMRGPNVCPR